MTIDAHRRIGRYIVFGPIASGGMATVHFGRLLGPVGFTRIVAIKALRPELAKDPEFIDAFVDEARLLARVQHPNVVPTLDVMTLGDELFLAMEYVHGVSLLQLRDHCESTGARIPPRIALSIACGVLEGLHAAHEAKSELGEPLGIVHRDISPHNLMIGVDGIARVLDFGIAKAANRLQHTRPGLFKGKLAYAAPEQILCEEVTRRTDVYSTGVVLWEALTGRSLFRGGPKADLLQRVLEGPIDPPSIHVLELSRAIDDVVMRALRRSPTARFPSARDFARALEESGEVAPARDVAEWLRGFAEPLMRDRAAQLEEIERAHALAIDRRPTDKNELASILTALEERDSHEAASDATTEPERLVVHALGTTARAIHTIPDGADTTVSAAPPTTSARPAARRTGGLAIAAIGLAALLAFESWPSNGPTPEPQPRAVETSTRAIVLAKTASVTPEIRHPPLERRASPRTGARPKPKTRACLPPYWVDANGIRHLKPECP